MQIRMCDILGEVVNYLGSQFVIINKHDAGITFRYNHLKFGLALAPFFGVEEGSIGLIVFNELPRLAVSHQISDPDLMDKLKTCVNFHVMSYA